MLKDGVLVQSFALYGFSLPSASTVSSLYGVQSILNQKTMSRLWEKEGILWEGDCERVRQINVGVHLVINLLSTTMLSSSNYCMQCLSAPTRNEVDKAHAHGIWLDIGVPSLRNLR